MNLTEETRTPLSDLLQDDDLIKAYRTNKRNAKRRGIEFLLTYEQWLLVWLSAGMDKLVMRGKNRGHYCLSRYHDQGNYEIGNVFIQKVEDNVSTGPQGRGKPKKPKHRKYLREHIKRVRVLRPVSANGVIYPSLTECGKAHGTSAQTVIQRIYSNSNSFKEWKYATPRNKNIMYSSCEMEQGSTQHEIP